MKENTKLSLNKIKITNLFNTFNHTVGINRDKGITLILGENGLGKTVILKMLKIVFDGDFISLKNYEFERLDFFFDDYKYSFFGTTDIDNTRLIAKKFKGRNVIEEFDLLDNNLNEKYYQGSISYKNKVNQQLLFENDFLSSDEYNRDLERKLRRHLGDAVERIGRDRWVDRRRDQVISTNTVINRYKRFLPKSFERLFSTPNWLQTLSDRVDVYLIETQRLKSRKGSDNYEDAILKISNELAQTIKEVLAEANEFATQLDRTYPTRLLTKINELERISDSELEDKLNMLDSRRKRLKEVGLVEPFEDDIQRTNIGDESTGSPERTELINNVLLVYIEDSNKKLDIYEHIADKLGVFINILNDRLNVKKVQIDREKGLDIKSIKFDDNSTKKKKKIPLTGLSSGEQHMIVMFYNLLFKCEKNSLILIDEPEISLHIGWQNNFINDLNRIKEITPFDAIIATHSPDIINDNWDLTVQLSDE